jgi:hypothetical protein
MQLLTIALSFMLSALFSDLSANPEKNGFDLSDSLIPSDKILGGGPDKDGIPAIDHPKFLKADESGFLQPDDRLLGMTYQGISKAYPIKILNHHEIVNDQFADEPVVVTFCPLCGSGIAYSARLTGKILHFGVSGLLYNSDVLLFDRETGSLWSQLMNKAISGSMRGKRLSPLAITHTTWKDWHQRFPDTLVLSSDTGYYRDYTQNPYKGYHLDRKIWFPVEQQSVRYHPKEMVMGIEINGQFKAYPFSELAKVKSEINDQLAGEHYSIHYNSIHQTAHVTDNNANEIPTVMTFWFAWYGFHPKTLIYQTQ